MLYYCYYKMYSSESNMYHLLQARHDPIVSAPISLGEEVIFDDLPDFSNMHDNNSIPRTPSYNLIENSELYLEIQDLTTPLAPPHVWNVSDSYLTDPLAPPQVGSVSDSYLTAPPAPPQNGNVSEPFLSPQGHFDFSANANDDPYSLLRPWDNTDQR